MSSRTIKPKDVIAYVRSGVTDRQLMDKYRVSSRGLQKIPGQLRHACAIEKCDLNRLLACPIEKPLISDERHILRQTLQSEGQIKNSLAQSGRVSAPADLMVR